MGVCIHAHRGLVSEEVLCAPLKQCLTGLKPTRKATCAFCRAPESSRCQLWACKRAPHLGLPHILVFVRQALNRRGPAYSRACACRILFFSPKQWKKMQNEASFSPIFAYPTKAIVDLLMSKENLKAA